MSKNSKVELSLIVEDEICLHLRHGKRGRR